MSLLCFACHRVVSYKVHKPVLPLKTRGVAFLSPLDLALSRQLRRIHLLMIRPCLDSAMYEELVRYIFDIARPGVLKEKHSGSSGRRPNSLSPSSEICIRLVRTNPNSDLVSDEGPSKISSL